MINIFFSQSYFLLKVTGNKKPFFKVFEHKNFLLETDFVQYGVRFIRLESFRHFGASTINRWALKSRFAR